MEGLPKYVDRTHRVDCVSMSGKGMGDGRSRVGARSETSQTFRLSEEDAQLMAYDGYPDVQHSLLESYAEVTSQSQVDVSVQIPEEGVPADTEDTPLHLHPDGRAKMLREATTAAERAAIFKHTVRVVSVTPLEAAE